MCGVSGVADAAAGNSPIREAGMSPFRGRFRTAPSRYSSECPATAPDHKQDRATPGAFRKLSSQLFQVLAASEWRRGQTNLASSGVAGCDGSLRTIPHIVVGAAHFARNRDPAQSAIQQNWF